MIVPLSNDEMGHIWLLLLANGYRNYTQDEVEKILGRELFARFQVTTALMRSGTKN